MLVGGVDSDLASVKKTKQPGAAILQSSITWQGRRKVWKSEGVGDT